MGIWRSAGFGSGGGSPYKGPYDSEAGYDIGDVVGDLEPSWFTYPDPEIWNKSVDSRNAHATVKQSSGGYNSLIVTFAGTYAPGAGADGNDWTLVISSGGVLAVSFELVTRRVLVTRPSGATVEQVRALLDARSELSARLAPGALGSWTQLNGSFGFSGGANPSYSVVAAVQATARVGKLPVAAVPGVAAKQAKGTITVTDGTNTDTLNVYIPSWIAAGAASNDWSIVFSESTGVSSRNNTTKTITVHSDATDSPFTLAGTFESAVGTGVLGKAGDTWGNTNSYTRAQWAAAFAGLTLSGGADAVAGTPAVAGNDIKATLAAAVAANADGNGWKVAFAQAGNGGIATDAANKLITVTFPAAWGTHDVSVNSAGNFVGGSGGVDVLSGSHTVAFSSTNANWTGKPADFVGNTYAFSGGKAVASPEYHSLFDGSGTVFEEDKPATFSWPNTTDDYRFLAVPAGTVFTLKRGTTNMLGSAAGKFAKVNTDPIDLNFDTDPLGLYDIYRATNVSGFTAGDYTLEVTKKHPVKHEGGMLFMAIEKVEPGESPSWRVGHGSAKWVGIGQPGLIRNANWHLHGIGWCGENTPGSPTSHPNMILADRFGSLYKQMSVSLEHGVLTRRTGYSYGGYGAVSNPTLAPITDLKDSPLAFVGEFDHSAKSPPETLSSGAHGVAARIGEHVVAIWYPGSGTAIKRGAAKVGSDGSLGTWSTWTANADPPSGVRVQKTGYLDIETERGYYMKGNAGYLHSSIGSNGALSWFDGTYVYQCSVSGSSPYDIVVARSTIIIGDEPYHWVNWVPVESGSGASVLVQQGGGSSYTDAEFGEKAFKNPPSGLTTSQKAAVRTAIGSFSGAYADLTDPPTIPTVPNDASIGKKAFENPPGDLDATEKAAVRTAIGAGTGNPLDIDTLPSGTEGDVAPGDKFAVSDGGTEESQTFEGVIKSFKNLTAHGSPAPNDQAAVVDTSAGVARKASFGKIVQGGISAGTGLTKTDASSEGRTEIKVSDGGIGNTQLAADAVETANVKDRSLTPVKFALTVPRNRGPWVSGSSYNVGDVSERAGEVYWCKTANSDTTFTATKWIQLTTSANTPTLTDAQLGDKAFTHPPSDLTDTEKKAVRTAIGAGVLPTDVVREGELEQKGVGWWHVLRGSKPDSTKEIRFLGASDAEAVTASGDWATGYPAGITKIEMYEVASSRYSDFRYENYGSLLGALKSGDAITLWSSDKDDPHSGATYGTFTLTAAPTESSDCYTLVGTMAVTGSWAYNDTIAVSIDDSPLRIAPDAIEDARGLVRDTVRQIGSAAGAGIVVVPGGTNEELGRISLSDLDLESEPVHTIPRALTGPYTWQAAFGSGLGTHKVLFKWVSNQILFGVDHRTVDQYITAATIKKGFKVRVDKLTGTPAKPDKTNYVLGVIKELYTTGAKTFGVIEPVSYFPEGTIADNDPVQVTFRGTAVRSTDVVFKPSPNPQEVLSAAAQRGMVAKFASAAKAGQGVHFTGRSDDRMNGHVLTLPPEAWLTDDVAAGHWGTATDHGVLNDVPIQGFVIPSAADMAAFYQLETNKSWAMDGFTGGVYSGRTLAAGDKIYPDSSIAAITANRTIAQTEWASIRKKTLKTGSHSGITITLPDPQAAGADPVYSATNGNVYVIENRDSNSALTVSVTSRSIWGEGETSGSTSLSIPAGQFVVLKIETIGGSKNWRGTNQAHPAYKASIFVSHLSLARNAMLPVVDVANHSPNQTTGASYTNNTIKLRTLPYQQYQLLSMANIRVHMNSSWSGNPPAWPLDIMEGTDRRARTYLEWPFISGIEEKALPVFASYIFTEGPSSQNRTFTTKCERSGSNGLDWWRFDNSFLMAIAIR